jgi:membrane-bound lytic murein transglycosylase B
MMRSSIPSTRRSRAPLALVLLASSLAALSFAAASPRTGRAAAAAHPAGALAAPEAADALLAPPSPSLPGLPSVSLALAAVPVEGAALRQARRSYDNVDARLRGHQVDRVTTDRDLTDLAAQQARVEADLAAARARRAGAASRLDDLTGAIADLGVRLYLSGGGAARMDAALTAEQPSINDFDRREVLGDASLDVLLAERAAYKARVAEADQRIADATSLLADLRSRADELRAARPAAAAAEQAAAPEVATARVAYEHARVLAEVEGADFPLVALDAYYRAARSTATDNPACGVRWWGLAGIARVEGRHGSYGGASLDEHGDTTKRIIGIQLNGTNNTQVVVDSDGGALDGDADYDRAVGPMQFIPQTWQRFAADGNDDGVATPFNMYDATLAAARYLCRASHGLGEDPGLRAAYFSYNHSDAYVERVLSFARFYANEIDVPEPVD